MLRVVTVLLTLVLSVSVFAADKPLHIIAFGAHPDDAEYRVGGVGAMWAKMGHKVKLVSVTNGDIGHWQMAGGELAQRRAKESKAVAAALGIEYEILDNHDGELEPTLENRRKLTRLIRQWDADVVIGHRPFDYHPDHRNVGVLMQDAAFMVTVPFWCPDVPALKKNPVFLYTADGFQKPYPFKADIVVSIDSVFEQKVKALMNQQSQIFEGGANGSQELVDRMPKDEAGKLDYLTKLWQRRADATRYRAALEKWYGKDRAATIKYVEAFEICEYGAQPSDETVRRLFPFFDK